MLMKLKVRVNDQPILESYNVSVQLDDTEHPKLIISTQSKDLKKLREYVDNMTPKKLILEIIYDD